jgi:hypothetical protein
MIEDELERLTAAITAGGELATLVEALKAREHARQAVRQELASLGTAARLDARQVESEARQRLVAWRELLLQSDALATSRQMLKKLLAAPLRARPIHSTGGSGWELTGQGSFGKLLAGIVPSSVAIIVASPPGIEPGSQP